MKILARHRPPYQRIYNISQLSPTFELQLFHRVIPLPTVPRRTVKFRISVSITLPRSRDFQAIFHVQGKFLFEF